MSQPPAERLGAALRAGDDSARAAVADAGDPTSRTTRAALRAEVVRDLAAQLTPTDRPLIRWLLEQEITQLESAGRGVTETLYTLVAALARFGQPEDVPLLWRARETTAEAQSGVDVEQLLRAGPDRVRDELRGLIQRKEPEAREAQAALHWIEAGIAAGAADDLAGYFHWADARFGLQVSGPT
jgi:hypothetical protein